MYESGQGSNVVLFTLYKVKFIFDKNSLTRCKLSCGGCQNSDSSYEVWGTLGIILLFLVVDTFQNNNPSETTKNTTSDKVGRFCSQNVIFFLLKQNRRVPRQTLLNCIFVTQRRSSFASLVCKSHLGNTTPLRGKSHVGKTDPIFHIVNLGYL